MSARVRAGLVVVLCVAFSPGAVAAADCGSQAAALVEDEADLPRIDLVSPVDRPPYCITLETIMAFAGRVNAHVAQCPTSDFAQQVSTWDQTRTGLRQAVRQAPLPAHAVAQSRRGAGCPTVARVAAAGGIEDVVGGS
jgi:hypothetical protein